MTRQEFDAHAHSYQKVLDESIGFSGEDSAYFSEYKIRDLRHELARSGRDVETALRLMDFGCGVGASMPHARKHFGKAELLGVDVSMESLEQARKHHGQLASFLVLEGSNAWPAEVASLDAAYAMCVFHHVDERSHIRLLVDIRQRLKSGGMMMVYEHNPFNPLTVRVVNNCPFDANAKLIRASVMAQRCRDAGFQDVRVQYRVFFPGFLKAFRFAERLLSWLPLGGQYYVRGFA
ncbi:class I SAM-dependent methyltransferase [Rhodoferax sp.]|uniref:class I SAM-dependent methyltransferase n=1 Tax=Rhodoferax sp. TaxID=50421 RepID=UPI002ACD45CF|nr:class I SAM-dependent methyltransferase [Rhodoferax sp.]MDZ7922004.1 class I SAM-dependent methyltransferase [Rhodoferax sp.]